MKIRQNYKPSRNVSVFCGFTSLITDYEILHALLLSWPKDVEKIQAKYKATS